MPNPILQLSLKTKGDLLRARQLARSAAELLGFDVTDQLCTAAATFDLVCQAHRATGRATVCLEIVEDCLHVISTPVPKSTAVKGAEEHPLYRISKPLPASTPVSRDDVPWMLRQLADLAPLDVFEEMRKINQELLRALLELARQRGARTINLPERVPRERRVCRESSRRTRPGARKASPARLKRA